MYESPVKVWEDVSRICEEISKAKEEYVYSQIRAVVDVDKEELLKALRYDRQQYEKGFSDGMAARDAEIVRCKYCKWRHDDSNPQYLPCTDWYPPDNFFCAYGDKGEEGDSHE